MSDITEQDIEQFIRFPETLSKQKYVAVEKAMDSSEELRELAAFFKDYDSIFSKLNAPKDRKNIIALALFQPEPEKPYANQLLLAAQSKQKSAQLKTVTTLASDEDETLVKVLYSRPDNEYQIRVLSNCITDEPCILSLQDVSTDLIISDEGKLTFTPDFEIEEYDWEQAAFALRVPVASFNCSANKLTEKEQTYNTGGLTVDLEIKDGQLSGAVSFTESNTESVTRVLIETEERGRCLTYCSGNSFYMPVGDEEKLNIWLFE